MRNQGFTLLELLVTVAILAATAFIATSTFMGVSEHANDQLVRVEMQEIAKAIRQFKQDTGYYPKTGPFEIDLADTGAGEVTDACLPSYLSSLSNDEKERWFYSPANFYQLITSTSPLNGTTHQLEKWNSETGRGWRGPYLNGFAEGYLDIRDGINGTIGGSPTALAGNKAGDPIVGTNIPDVEGIADPFEYRAEKDGGNTLLDWSATHSGGTEREVWGRPYLVFDWDTKPWIMSMGPDGNFENGEYDPDNNKDDIVLNIK